MGTIVERRTKAGKITYSAQISIMRAGAIAHRESKTFRDRKMATGWLEKREAELSKPGGMAAAKIGKETLADAIDKYVATTRKGIGKTKSQVLEALKGFEIAQKRCADITSQDIVDLAETLSEGRQPQTVGNYLSHLQAVFAVAKHAWGMDLDAEAMAGATLVAKRLGLISKSASRDRRPTLAELDKLMEHFTTVQKRRRDSIPMTKIIPFAIFSTRRQDEISRLARADLEPGRVLVRDMKHPGEKAGNDTWCDLVPEAEAIIASMPKVGPLIFPASTDAMSAAFTRACKLLGIEDLRFHDLRHEGVSRLFEMNWTIPHVATVSGHRSWSSLKRYTHLRTTGDKYKDWKWLNVIQK